MYYASLAKAAMIGLIVRSKLVSGNDIPVSRCTIRREEVEEIDNLPSAFENKEPPFTMALGDISIDHSRLRQIVDSQLMLMAAKDTISVTRDEFIWLCQQACKAHLLDLKVGSQQAEIDRLMLEYCPNDMSLLQKEQWEASQRKVLETLNPESIT